MVGLSGSCSAKSSGISPPAPSCGVDRILTLKWRAVSQGAVEREKILCVLQIFVVDFDEFSAVKSQNAL